jgi:hypothetical protein
VPPLTPIGDGVSIPPIVTAPDMIVALAATPNNSVKLNGSGVVSVACASVVAQNCPAMPPIVSVAQVCVLLLDDAVSRTLTVLPTVTVPAVAVKAPPFTLYRPPATLIADAASIPVTVIGADVAVESMPHPTGRQT